ncbi:MAG: DUF4157 domain-containing protein [Nitrosomonas sp.]|nr:DUF4157 domain-containing protein [Nitrosomonas sp.]
MITTQQRAAPKPFFPVQASILQRKCACGNHTMAGGECADCARKKMGLQRKLTIGASNDPLEQEADRIADQVMASSSYGAVSSTSVRIQRFTGNTSGQGMEVPPSVERVLASPGRPLEPALRQDMEGRFGYDFSGVRIHTGGTAEQSARDVNAHAYTVSNDVVFGAGQFVPGTNVGQRLIAHELVHVVQQMKIDRVRESQSYSSQTARVPELNSVGSTVRSRRLFRAIEYIEEVTGADAERYLVRFDHSLEAATRVVSSTTDPEANDLREAIELLRTLRTDGRITCWRTVAHGRYYASYHAPSGQIRLHVNFRSAATWPGTILHEAIHALHAQRFPRLSQLYAEVLAAGGTANERLGVLLVKWKAWTEYWAYRRVAEYENLRQVDPSLRQDSHQVAIREPDVQRATSRLRHETGEEFDPSSWSPPARYRARVRSPRRAD